LLEIGEVVDRVDYHGKVYGIFQVKLLAVRNGNAVIRFSLPWVQYGMKPMWHETAL
jgi:hypothetical protein